MGIWKSNLHAVSAGPYTIHRSISALTAGPPSGTPVRGAGPRYISKLSSADSATLRSAHLEGIGHLRKALGILLTEPPSGERDNKEGVEEFVEGLAGWKETGTEFFCHCWYGLFSLAYAQAGSQRDALDSLETAFRTSLKSGEAFYLAELHRLKGEYQIGNVPQAELFQVLS